MGGFVDSYIYKDTLNKILKIENAIKRLEMDGFLINKKEFRDIVAATRASNDKNDLKYLKKAVLLNELSRHLNRLESIDNYYKWTKFRINNDNNVKLFLDAYVRDTLDILKVVNEEIKEYGFGYLEKFVTKFYNLVYFLIKLEIGLHGESEIYKEMYGHSSHFYCLNEIMISDINRNYTSSTDRQDLKDMLKEKKYSDISYVLLQLVNCDRKIKKLLRLDVDGKKLSKNKD